MKVMPLKTAGENPYKRHTAATAFSFLFVNNEVIFAKSKKDNTKNTKFIDKPCHLENTPGVREHTVCRTK